MLVASFYIALIDYVMSPFWSQCVSPSKMGPTLVTCMLVGLMLGWHALAEQGAARAVPPSPPKNSKSYNTYKNFIFIEKI